MTASFVFSPSSPDFWAAAMTWLWLVASGLVLLLFVLMAAEPWMRPGPPDETATTPPSGSTTSDSCCSSPKNPEASLEERTFATGSALWGPNPVQVPPDASPFHTPDSAFLVPQETAENFHEARRRESGRSTDPEPFATWSRRKALGLEPQELADKLPGQWLWSATRQAFVWIVDAPIPAPSSEPPPAQPALQTKPDPAEFHTLVVDPRPPADWSGYPYSNPPTPPL